MHTLSQLAVFVFASPASAQDFGERGLEVHVVSELGLGATMTSESGGVRFESTGLLRVEMFAIGLTGGISGAPYDYGALDGGVVAGAGLELVDRLRLEALGEVGIRRVSIERGGLLSDDPGYHYTTGTAGARLGFDWRFAPDTSSFAAMIGFSIYGRFDLAPERAISYPYRSCGLFSEECSSAEGSGTVGGRHEFGAVVRFGFDSALH
jgi:hypothetical protein